MTDYHREFIRELHQMADRRNVVEVFGDAVGMMSAALQTAIPADRKAAEETYMQMILDTVAPAHILTLNS